MSSFRLPDLWLKIAIVRAVLPADAPQPSDSFLADCAIRRHAAAKAPTFSKMMAGKLMLDGAVLRDLAAALEMLIVDPGHLSVAAVHAERSKPLALYPDAILGTLPVFAAGVHRLAVASVSVSQLAGAVRDGLSLLRADDRGAAVPLRVSGTPDRLTPLVLRRRERIIVQPDREVQFLEPRTPMQVHVPPRPEPQLVLAFEMRTDDAILVEPWEACASWFGVRHQAAGRPLALLDADSFVAECNGEFWIQAVGFDIAAETSMAPGETLAGDRLGLPIPIAKAIEGCPPRWPPAYARIIALINYARSFAKREPHGTFEPAPRLYQGLYGVRTADASNRVAV